MKKFILLAGLLFATGAFAQCRRCTGPPTAKDAQCVGGATTGGCACIEGSSGRYRLCATCGFCSFGYCLYGCSSAQAGLASPSAVPVSQQAWITNAKLSSRIALQSPDMAGVVGFVRDTLAKQSCTNWSGAGSIDGEGLEWAMITKIGTTEIVITKTVGPIQHTEDLVLSPSSWSLTTDHLVTVRESFLK